MKWHILLILPAFCVTGCIIKDDPPKVKCFPDAVFFTNDDTGTDNDYNISYLVTFENEKVSVLDYFNSEGYSGLYTPSYSGDLISSVIWEETFPTYYKYKYEFSRNGSLISERRYYRFDIDQYVLLSKDVLIYNSDDRLITREFYNASNTKIGWNEYSYSGSSSSPSRITSYPSGITYDYKYGSHKYPLRDLLQLRGQLVAFTREIVEIIITETSGNVTTVSYSYTYNEHNQAEKVTITDDESELVNTYEFTYVCED